MPSLTAPRILHVWFDDIGPAGWFVPSAAVDERIHHDFHVVYETMTRPEADRDAWLATPETSLALVLLLDQFPRNMFRATPMAFAADALGLEVAKAAIARGHDLETPVERRVFFYLPYEHSERLADQDEAVRLIRERADISDYLAYAEDHRDIIRRFGRFPHRNAILGRQSTEEERAYLEGGGATYGVAKAPGAVPPATR